MALTLLQIAQEACGELGLQIPAAVASAADVQTRQLYTLINREGDALKRTHQWTALTNLFTISVGNPTITTGNTVLGSSIINGIPSTAGIEPGIFVVSGATIPVAARVITVDPSGTQVTMDMVATGTATGTALTFAQDTYPEPVDFDRFINRTGWDRTNRWELLGPTSPQLDQWHQSGIVTTGPRRFFRQLGSNPLGTYRLWPPPQNVGSPFQIAQEYTSSYWCQSAGGIGQTSMVADTDIPLLDSQAIVLGVKWRFFAIKQFDYAPLQQEYLDYVQQLIARDGGAPTLSMRKRGYPLLITPANVQDGYFPGGTGPNMS